MEFEALESLVAHLCAESEGCWVFLSFLGVFPPMLEDDPASFRLQALLKGP